MTVLDVRDAVDLFAGAFIAAPELERPDNLLHEAKEPTAVDADKPGFRHKLESLDRDNRDDVRDRAIAVSPARAVRSRTTPRRKAPERSGPRPQARERSIAVVVAMTLYAAGAGPAGARGRTRRRMTARA